MKIPTKFSSERKLTLMMTEEAAHTINAAYDWARSFSSEEGYHFAFIVCEYIGGILEELEQGYMTPRLDADASIRFSRKTYQYINLDLVPKDKSDKGKGKKLRGAWRVFYDFADMNSDGEVDTLRFLGVYPAAVHPVILEAKGK